MPDPVAGCWRFADFKHVQIQNSHPFIPRISFFYHHFMPHFVACQAQRRARGHQSQKVVQHLGAVVYGSHPGFAAEVIEVYRSGTSMFWTHSHPVNLQDFFGETDYCDAKHVCIACGATCFWGSYVINGFNARVSTASCLEMHTSALRACTRAWNVISLHPIPEPCKRPTRHLRVSCDPYPELHAIRHGFIFGHISLVSRGSQETSADRRWKSVHWTIIRLGLKWLVNIGKHFSLMSQRSLYAISEDDEDPLADLGETEDLTEPTES